MATIDIIGMIRGRRQARAAGIEELAVRLAKGELVAPEEIEAVLDRTGCDEEMLQAAVDRIERRAALLAAVARGNTAEARLDKIDAEIGKAFDAVAEAQRKHAAVVAKHADERTELRHAIEAGNRAHNELLDPSSLSPADLARLTAARDAWQTAEREMSELRRGMLELRLSLERAERDLVDATEQAKVNRGNADIQHRRDACENAVAARKARLKDAEADLVKREQTRAEAEAAVQAIETELRR